MKLISIGADPEFIIRQKASTLPVSMAGLLPGSKQEPHPLIGGAIHPDNVMAELSIDPATSKRGFAKNVHVMMSQLHEMMDKQAFEVTDLAVATYTDEELEHPLAQLAGCDPEWDAYNLRLRHSHYGVSKKRVAGGHIHIGIDIPRVVIPIFVKLLDICIAMPMLKLDQVERRKWYGKAGGFRLKPYGIEYRTPTNRWAHSKEGCEFIYEQVKRAISLVPAVLQNQSDHRVNYWHLVYGPAGRYGSRIGLDTYMLQNTINMPAYSGAVRMRPAVNDFYQHYTSDKLPTF